MSRDTRTTTPDFDVNDGSNRFGRRAFALIGAAGIAAGASALASPESAGARPRTDDPAALLSAVTTSVATIDDLKAAPGAADGDTAYVVSYRSTAPGVGGGVFYWAAAATDDENGGTIIAATGVATGRWKRPATTELEASWFGVDGTGADDQSARIQAAVDSLATGGKIYFDAGVFRIENTITVTTVPITFIGAGVGDLRDANQAEIDLGTQLLVKTGDQDAFVLRGVRGGGFRDLQMRGDIGPDSRPMLTGGSFIRTETHPDDPTQNNYFLSFYACRFKEGYNGITLQGCNTVRFQHCVWNGFRGEQVVLLNGLGDATRADPVEFVQCAISAGTHNPDTDGFVLDGLGGSVKFIATAVLFGRNGIWMRNTTGSPSLPKFLYFTGGGFENSHGYPILLEAGADAKFSNTYVSCDGLTDCIRITNGFTGTAMFSDVVVRSGARHGFDIDSTRIAITGCVIGNNGRNAHPNFSQAIVGASASGGNVRITTAGAHGWESDDFVTIQNAGGTTPLNGKWQVAVVSPSELDLIGASLGGYTGGGIVFRNGSGINLRANASRTVITGNVIGGLAEGTNRQDYGIVSASADVLVSSNDLNGNQSGPYLQWGTQGTEARFLNNKGYTQYDGWLSVRLAGDVANGLYDFGDLLYLDGRRVRLYKIVRKTSAGTAGVRLLVDGTAVGGADTSASVSTAGTSFQSPFVVDGLSAPRRVQLRVSNASGAKDLEVQFAYQIVG
jgi:hypothetical protein